MLTARSALYSFVVAFLWYQTAFAAPALDQARLTQANEDVDNWLTYGRTFDEKRFSPLTDINEKTVKDLGLAWYFDTDHNRGLEATPIVVDGVMYTTGNWNFVYANDAATGKLLWKYDPQVDKTRAGFLCCDVVNRGVAAWGDKIFMGTIDGYLIALNRFTGKEVWKTLTIDLSKPYTITGAPRVVKGKVIIGNGGAEYGVRGYVTAYDANNGKQVWRFYTVPGEGAPESAAIAMAEKTWSGTEWKKYGGGGTVWDSMSYDAVLNQLYIGVGNAGPWNKKLRNPEGKDNLFTASIVSLNPDTGEYLWHYQQTPNDGWDYTSTQHMILTDMEWQGKMRKVLLQAPKNGFFFVIDRTSGEYLSAKPYANVNWALGYDDKGRPIINPKKDYANGKQMVRPAPIGAHNWHPMSYSEQTDLVYISALDSVFEYEADNAYQKKDGVWNTGMKVMNIPDTEPLFLESVTREMVRGELIAWNPKTQTPAWTIHHPNSWNGGVLSTAGNLVLQGTADQTLNVYNATDGALLWSYPTQSGVVAPPITYRVNGEQYIAVMAGWGGLMGISGGIKPPPSAKNGRILAFKLNAKQSLPPVPAPKTRFDPPARTSADDKIIEQGRVLYNSYCIGCHGPGLISNDALPDLRFIHPAAHASFIDIVLRGALATNGMPRFDKVMDVKEAEALQAYILNEANKEAERKNDPDSQWWIKVKEKVYSTLGKVLRAVM